MAAKWTAGTPVTIGGAVGDDIAMSVEGVTDTNGRQSANIDLGAVSARTNTFLIDFKTQWQATPTVGKEARVYLKEKAFNNATWTNDDGEGDIALSAEDKLRGLLYIGSIVCDEAAANIPTLMRPTMVEINVQTVALVLFTEAGAAINATDSNTQGTITPMTLADA